MSMSLHERHPARPQSIARLRHAVAAFADSHGASARQREDIALAVSEAVSNAVRHAYGDRNDDGTVELQAQVRSRTLEILVCDEGDGMRSRSTSPGMGIGLALIGQVAQDLIVESRAPAPGVRLRMTFAIG
jgi:serine/threonine-protein kinase RsbW